MSGPQSIALVVIAAMVRFKIYGLMKFTPADIDPPPSAHELATRAAAMLDLLHHDIQAAHRRSTGYRLHTRAGAAQRSQDDQLLPIKTVAFKAPGSSASAKPVRPAASGLLGRRRATPTSKEGTNT